MNKNQILNVTLIIVGALLVFHFGIFFKLIPYEIVWGGRLQNDQEMFVFESISIILNLVLGLLLLVKARKISVKISHKFINAGLWVYFGLFVLNTFGNVLAETTFEKFFAIITILLCFNLWMIIKVKSPKQY